MSGTNVDHMVSIIVFLAGMLIFVGLFGQTVATGVSYQQHKGLATRASDLLDNILLNPGNKNNWSQTDWNQPTDIPIGFGIQDPEFVQYQVSSFSLMRLYPTSGTAVIYRGQTFCNNSMVWGSSLLVPSSQMINYSKASAMMGINGTYGFSLTVSPTVDVSVSEVSYNPLNVSVVVEGQGFALANALVNYCLISVTGYDVPGNPCFTLNYGSTSTDAAGSVYLDLSSYDLNQKSYAIVVYASLSGLSGVGYFGHSLYTANSVVPLVASFEGRTVLLAHSYDINGQGYNGSLTYNATFLRAKDMIQATLNDGNATATGELSLCSIPANGYDSVTLGQDSLGVLVVAYGKSALESGIVVMPWGFSSLGFSVTFGGQYTSQNWISTDIRQVLVNGVPYQAKLALWSSAGTGGTG